MVLARAIAYLCFFSSTVQYKLSVNTTCYVVKSTSLTLHERVHTYIYIYMYKNEIYMYKNEW